MRDLRREAAALANRDRLVDAVEDAGGLVPHVRDVDAAETAGDLRQLDDLVGRRERARHVEEPGAQTEAPVRHPLLDERRASSAARLASPSVDLADDARADRPLADERADIDGFLERLELREKRRQRHGEDPSGPSMSVVTPCRT